MDDYYRPNSLDDAVEWLSKMRSSGATALIAAGCTDLFPATERKSLPGPVLDITAIDGIRGIECNPGGWRFGAATTWTEIVRTPLPRAFDGLKAAAREIGSVQIQNAGTLGGNICNASPAADGMPCWLTLDAEVELASRRGIRRLPVSSFVTGARRTELKPGEILAAIHVPDSAAAGVSDFRKLGARKYLVISIAMVAARLICEGSRIAKAAISVGACNEVAVRLHRLETWLEGKAFPEAYGFDDVIVREDLDPITDFRSDRDHRLSGSVELVRRSLRSCHPGA